MSIEETYKGMWSSDPDLLRSLLDAGNTILHLDGTRSALIRVRKRESHDSYEIETDFGDWRTYHIGVHVVSTFLIPPRPLVLEPRPLGWKHLEMNEEAIAVDGVWSFYAWANGDWSIHCDGVEVALKWGNENPDLDFDTAKAAIHEWRVNHLKSMLP